MNKSIFIVFVTALLYFNCKNVHAQLPCCVNLKSTLDQQTQKCSALGAEIATLKAKLKKETKVVVPGGGPGSVTKPQMGPDFEAIKFNEELKKKIAPKEAELRQCETLASNTQRQYTDCQSQGCGTLSVSPKTLNFAAMGGQQIVNVSSDMAWSYTGSSSWATIGRNGNQLTVTCSPNTWGVKRVANFTINTTGGKSETVHISQVAGAPGTLSVAPTSVTLPASGGQTRITVTSSDPGWTASVSGIDRWIDVKKSGNQIIIKSNENGSKRDRSGTVIVSGAGTKVTIAVSQAPVVFCDQNTMMESAIDQTNRSANNLEASLRFPSAVNLTIVTNRDAATKDILGISLKNNQSTFLLTGSLPSDAKISFALSPHKKALVMVYSSNLSSAGTLLVFDVATGKQLYMLSITGATGWQWGFANNDACFLYKTQYSTTAEKLRY
ncbi:BACON domain-containing protein [Haliscomenobacter hydrossis]|uniref:BACON domain-containing protein n=1 Tax=Haliscomenobacter hydrossis (strain ATCC 27775 / DSM 1100 / LMG 10767 / O) TaxID=760192 RepID=F4L7W0_HALH1|nr:BACON domain-containing protein [Haliscomenobacter hydrossis]AEE54468.1 hypothetical protein Halhy_6652 [Haliscomenobacter hydrossis DSM 1100]